MLRRYLLLGLCLALAGAVLGGSASARPQRAQLEQAIRSTVLVLTLDDELNVIASGSGSIVDPRGMVLSNFHVVGDTDRGQLYNSEGLVGIALTRDLRQPAVPLFIGKVIRGDPELDLSLIALVADVEGKDLKGCLNLPTYGIGDSEALGPGDNLTAIGFPGIGGYSYTVTTGQVSGFETTRQGVVTWIKTDTEISPGNSGGSAVDDEGLLIGVPTAGRIAEEGSGKLGLVRPIELAGELLAGLDQVQIPGCNARAGTTTTGPGTQTKQAVVTLTGRVVSADSGRPISGAIFVILKPGVKWASVTKRNLEASIFDAVKTDSRGNFETTEPIDVDTAYSVGIVADGFGDLLEDDLVFREIYEGGNIIDLGDIGMKRR